MLAWYSSFQEMKLIQRRFLQGGASHDNEGGVSFPLPGLSFPLPGLSFPLPGMSLPYPGMSLPNPSMSLPNPGMSLPNPGMSLSHSASIVPTMTPSSNTASKGSNTEMPSHPEQAVDCVGRDSTTSTRILVQLDVDSVSNDPSFLDGLVKSIVTFGEVHFSLCQKSGNQRVLLEPVSSQEQYNATVTGLDVTSNTSDAAPSNNPGKTRCCDDEPCCGTNSFII